MKKVIIADDNPEFLEVLKELFEDGGFEVLALNDGEQLLKALARGVQCDLVVTDIVMPFQDGLGVIMQVKKSYPWIKCIAISGGGRVVAESYLNIAERMGAQAIFQKPFDIEKLLEKARELVCE